MSSFDAIRARAAERKGGEDQLAALLSPVADAGALAALDDDRVLAEMARRIFCSGFVWRVIDAKWPGFEAAFLGFEPRRLNFEPDEFWERLIADPRIVRHAQKIKAVRHNAGFVVEIAAEHGSFGRFLADWPASDQVGLMALLARRGARLGGNTGQYFLRFVGKDSFILSRDVVLCLRQSGLDIPEAPSAARDLARIQARFNEWAAQSGLSYTHLSRICALSVGDNLPAAALRSHQDE